MFRRQRVLVLSLVACAAGAFMAPAAEAKTVCVHAALTKGSVCPSTFTTDGVDNFTSINDAIAATADGDAIQVERGTYAETVKPYAIRGVTIFGDPDGPRPVITSASDANAPPANAPQATVDLAFGGPAKAQTFRHLQIKQTGNAASALAMAVGSNTGGGAGPDVRLDDVSITSTGLCLRSNGVVTMTDVDATRSGPLTTINSPCVSVGGAASTWTGGTVEDSTVGTDGAIAAGGMTIDRVTVHSASTPAINAGTGLRLTHVVASSGGAVAVQDQFGAERGPTIENSLLTATAPGSTVVGIGSTAVLRNVTVVGAGAGVRAYSGGGLRNVGTQVSVINSVVRAPDGDLQADVGEKGGCSFGPVLGGGSGGVDCADGTLTASSTDYRPRSNDRVTDAGGNISDDPLFVNATLGATQDFHVQSGSPTIDVGATVPAGDLDLDGVARPRAGTLPDMGAYESPFLGPQPVVVSPAPSESSTSTPAASNPPPPPSNAFSILGAPKVGKDGTVTLVVKPVSAGKAIVFATIPGSVKASNQGAGARATKKKPAKKKPVPPTPQAFANAAAMAAAGQALTFTLKPSKPAQSAIKKLKGTKKLVVTLRVDFTPAGGVAATRTLTVKISAPKKAKPKKH